MNTNFERILKINDHKIGENCPAYFIADVAANHDGDLGKAKELIYMAAEAGADAAKFQHFTAQTIVSDKGFKDLGNSQSHQAQWKKSVFDVYKDASLDFDWTPVLVETCKKAKIDFFTSPYSFDLVEKVDSYVPAYKVGSGDITWGEIITAMAKKNKPMFIATGASTLDEVAKSIETCLRYNNQICLMQCNTNYTASLENFKYINLNVLNTYKAMFPNIILGLSDHTPGHATVLGAIALGAKAIEKHFTDDNNREGPDHKFSMDPKAWREMVERSRELEYSLGTGVKKVEENEMHTVVLQRRAIRASRNIKIGETFSEENMEVLRPCPTDGISPDSINVISGNTSNRNISLGEHIRWKDLN